MESSIKLGRIWGVPIGLHYSWFLIFGLVTWSFAVGFLPQDEPGLSTAVYWGLGLLTSLLLFGSVLVHELAHAFVALRNKVPVREINLFIFGGVAQLTEEPKSPGAAFRIAAVGPLASFVLALLFGLLWLLDRHIPYLAAPSYELMRINLILALFNLIPGFPLDGGQILRALLWSWTGNLYRANKIASFSGQIFAFGFIGVGIVVMIFWSFFNGLWLIFIGWFLQNAAAATYARSSVQLLLKGATAGQAMNRDLRTVPGLLPVSQLITEETTDTQRYFFVRDEPDEPLQGLVTTADLQEISPRKWRFTTARQVMRPLDHLTSVPPDTDLVAALKMMEAKKTPQLPVKDGDQILGVLTHDSVIEFVQLRSALKAHSGG